MTQPSQSSPEVPDHAYRRLIAKLNHGTSPVAPVTMFSDWWLHLATAPDKQLELAKSAQESVAAWFRFVNAGCPAEESERPISPTKRDHRFAHNGWSSPPFAALEQAFLLAEDWADQATTNVPGLSQDHEKSMRFMMRQMLDAVAPSNFLPTNPEALECTVTEKGANLLRGGATLSHDLRDKLTGANPERPNRVGKDVATAKGQVVYRNHLIELIQYAPTTDTVHPEPVLIVPAWIMKYYILDLSPENSMVQYLTAQGFTVFMISWRNPSEEDASLGMDDYLELGPLAALSEITTITGSPKVHTAGYCLGGTLLSIAAATLARKADTPVASMTLFAAQTDFTEAGELTLFINESQVSFLEDAMAEQGFLEAEQMLGAFQMLRSNDLIWSHMVRAYLLGRPDMPMNDLMAWNADSTRLPARMHSEYLRKMFLQNDLAAGRYQVDGHAVSLRDIRVPVFGVGTETDHIAPWTSVYKIHNLVHADVTFVLTNGGHNAGVISEPGHHHRHYKMHTTRDTDKALSAADWQDAAQRQEGSWWLAWSAWLSDLSSKKISPPKMGRKLAEAPGTYVMME